MNKIGGEKVISIYWFAILFIVAAAIVYMVGIFYGQPYDVREIEADLLGNKAADCLVEGGKLKQPLTQENLNNFLGKCGINFQTEDAYDWNSVGQYYLELVVYDFSTYSAGASSLMSFSEGNVNLRAPCETGIKGKSFPSCIEKNLYVVDDFDNSYVIKIISSVGKNEKNAR